jgi:hypothetical protein
MLKRSFPRMKNGIGAKHDYYDAAFEEEPHMCTSEASRMALSRNDAM